MSLVGPLLPLFSYKNTLAYPYLYQREGVGQGRGRGLRADPHPARANQYPVAHRSDGVSASVANAILTSSFTAASSAMEKL